ncbi:mycothiol transferase [Kitasatospora griseola]|uniref:mycothiol transferase n=1 Tax=Kitasatospora griseola TaxID=2064 RepID=UPI00381FE0AD
MAITDPKSDLRRYLQDAREAVLWKLDGLPEHDVRRPLTPTGTNLLGLVKHLAGVELLYLGWVFDRHYGEPVAWFRPDLGHMIAETERHAGHADIVRELIDGAVGHRPGAERMPARDDTWWSRYRERVAAAAEQN